MIKIIIGIYQSIKNAISAANEFEEKCLSVANCNKQTFKKYCTSHEACYFKNK